MTSASPAYAQPTAAIAEQLFRDGRTLMAQGRTDEACEKFASSQRLAPALGTLLNFALCREKQGRNATAWSLFADAEAQAMREGDKVRASIARDHETALSPQLKKVVIEVPVPPPGMVVKLDGVPLPAGALGTEIPLDPGDHDLVVTAPGKKAWRQAKLNLGPSAMTVHVRVELEDEAPPAAPAVAAPAAVVTPSPLAMPGPPLAEEPAPASPTNVKRVAGFVVGGAGIVALAIGGGYGLTAIGRKNDESKFPPNSEDQLTVYNQAKDAQTLGLVFAGVGVVALGSGVALVLTSQQARSETPAATLRVSPAWAPGLAGARLSGTF